MVADRLYHSGRGGNLALRLTAKFRSASDRAAALRLDRVVGRFARRDWTLAEVLVTVDVNAMGLTTTWVVSGPGPLVGAYATAWAAKLKSRRDTYDGGVTQIPVVTAAHVESGEE